MTNSTLFNNNKTQAVRLPKAVAFPDDVRRVDILKIGKARLIVPTGSRWDDFFAEGPKATPDFLSEREQPEIERRDDF